MTLRAAYPGWQSLIAPRRQVYISTEGMRFPQRFIPTRWSRLCDAVKKVGHEEVDPVYEAALCQDYMCPWLPVDLESAVYAFRRWTAMRFLIDGGMTVYVRAE